MDSRENLHPLWSDLSARADAARKAYRESDGGAYATGAFIAALTRLGFDWAGIKHEMAENDPNQKTGPGS